MRDIENSEDIKAFVDGFYLKIQEDDLLAPIFALRIAPNAWQPHLDRMYGFWETVLFHKQLYKGNSFGKHIGLPVEKKHFQHWGVLFTKNMDELFAGEIADDAKRRVDSMVELFSSKMEYVRSNPSFKGIV